jgi:hypothetical protein
MSIVGPAGVVGHAVCCLGNRHACSVLQYPIGPRIVWAVIASALPSTRHFARTRFRLQVCLCAFELLQLADDVIDLTLLAGGIYMCDVQ